MMNQEEALQETVPSPKPVLRSIAAREDEGKTVLTGRKIQSSITYELLEKIGVGGMGEVYKARLMSNLGTSEVVALKKIRNDLAIADPEDRKEVRDRFLQEASIIAELNGHPNIVGFRGADIMESDGDAGGELYFVMEYVRGFDLKELLALHRIDTRHLLAGRALMIPNEFIGFLLFKVANALHHAHTYRFSDGSHGIAHLDLSPGNILINGQLGLIKISDFGIASTLAEMRAKIAKGYFLGKPAYMAPELIEHDIADFTVDFYSLGVIMYQLLTGINPNRIAGLTQLPNQEVASVIADYQKRPLVPPHRIAKGINQELSEIVMTMLEYKRENRYSSACRLRDLVGEVVYRHGYGPTDHSFALYLNKMKMIQLVHLQRDETGNLDPVKIGRREYDMKMLEMVEMFDAHAAPLWLHGDALAQLAEGRNPCRA
ncbi:MAG: serine/threonine protein kinase [Magnetococcales bacterium]|nr:serine/threonine protein kinase [Magnetococcales bacterium]